MNRSWQITLMRNGVLLLLLLCTRSWAETFELHTSVQQQPLASYLYYYQDSENLLNIADIKNLPENAWQHNNRQAFNHGYNDATWWLRISISNQEAWKLDRLLEISYPVLDYLSVYILGNNQQQTLHLGDKLPFDQRPINHRNFVMPLQWEPNETLTVYLSVRSSSSIQVPITLWEEQSFFNHDRTQTLIHGVYYGIMFVMVVYNLFVYLAVGERNYLYYVLFVCSMPLFLASLSGFAFQYLWPDATRWNDQAILVTLSAAVAFGSLFTHNFLRLYELKSPIRYAGFVCAGGAGIIMIMALLLPYNIVIRTLIPFAGVVCCYGFSSGVFRWYSGGLSAKYYTIAWSSLLGGGIILAFSKYNLLPKNLFTDYATQIGSALEVTLLSFALAERINQERRMRFEAQQDALNTERELRHAREQALEIQKQATESLEHRVQERTIELEQLNKKLEELSDTDQLTGLKNRRFLDRVLEEEYARCSRYQHSMALLLMDIDHFKHFNDTYGHLIGDECLREVAQAIRKGLRWPSDRPTRYGGEEFCVLLPETAVEGALTVAERIRECVASMEFKVKNQSVPVTVSIGLMVTVPTTDNDCADMLAKADEALYQSKANGRNRVTLYCVDSDKLSAAPVPASSSQPPHK
ncbi:MAG: diguanylate cyclase [Pseudomonadales bacterium]|nr:diguanylate cyclase [Pseudomonadales bacterium]RLU02138.1 MAG: diguanylate cyclase [Ketobacter sp.]